MRFYRQPETKSCVGLTNLKVGTRFLLFKNTQIEKTVKKLEIDTAQQKGRTKKIIQKMEESIDPARTKLRQTTQKLGDLKVTKSGFNKGKDLKK